LKKDLILEKKLLFYDGEERAYPTCILEDNVFNLITKGYYYNKPTYQDFFYTLDKMKELIIDEKIKYIAMPKIGCGLDKLSWTEVRKYIIQIFEGLDLEILVCSI